MEVVLYQDTWRYFPIYRSPVFPLKSWRTIQKQSLEAFFINSALLHLFHNCQKQWNIKCDPAWYCWPNANAFTSFHVHHVEIILLSFSCWNIIIFYCNTMLNIFISWAALGKRVNLVHFKGTFTLCPCQNPFQYPLQFSCPSHRLHWIRIPVSFRLNFMSTTASPDVKVWFCIGTCKIRMETDVRISFSRSGDRSKRNGR